MAGDRGVRADVVIVGAGASGIMAAICAARRGAKVILCERLSSAGKKILASGNGRCNLSNERLHPEFFNVSSRAIVASILNFFPNKSIEGFFEGLGLKMVSREGRVFPMSNQSSSVLTVLQMELERLCVPINYNFPARSIQKTGKTFSVKGPAEYSIQAEKVILACGGKSYPALGSDGSGYDLARLFGHKIVVPVPVAVPLVVKDGLCHILQGQRIWVKAKSLIGNVEGQEAEGELLFTKYGLSGTAILDISADISIAINRAGRKDVCIIVDLVPSMGQSALAAELEARKRRGLAKHMLVGILPNKVSNAIWERLSNMEPEMMAAALKTWRFCVSATRGWNEAEFTAGGIDVNEVKDVSLESKLQDSLYFAGEILDVNGLRGGYNLAWAWASGAVAGMLQ